jgi:DNA-binding transcriptional ArsR family regulator
VIQSLDAEASLRALAHPGRRRMLQLVWDGERSSTELAERCGLSKPAASQHLKVLREAGLVSVRVDGTRRLYRARAKQLAELRTFLDGFWGDRLENLRAAVEGPPPRRRRRS